MILNEKAVDCKVVCIFEIYNTDIKFLFMDMFWFGEVINFCARPVLEAYHISSRQ